MLAYGPPGLKGLRPINPGLTARGYMLLALRAAYAMLLACRYRFNGYRPQLERTVDDDVQHGWTLRRDCPLHGSR